MGRRRGPGEGNQHMTYFAISLRSWMVRAGFPGVIASRQRVTRTPRTRTRDTSHKPRNTPTGSRSPGTFR